MAFTLLACSDIRAQKVNLELPFAEPPRSLDELRETVERVFREEEGAIKQAMHVTDVRPCEPFTVSRIQRYDDDAQAWADIHGVDQLQPYDQLYIFRRNSTRADISPQHELPSPRLSSFFQPVAAPRHAAVPSYAKTTPASAALQERRNQERVPAYRDEESDGANHHGDGRRPLSAAQRATLHGGVRTSSAMGGPGVRHTDGYANVTPPAAKLNAATLSSPSPYLRELTTPEQVQHLFDLADEARGGVLGPNAFSAIFRAADIRFPADVVQDLYHGFAHKTHGEWSMTLEDFTRYAAAFPVAVSVAYQRLTNQDRAETLRQAQVESARVIGGLQRQVSEMEARLAAAKKELAREEQKRSRIQDDLSELSRQQDPDYAREEQNVLDKEVSVFRYRERLAKEERDYERLAMEQRRRSAHYALDGSNLKDTDYDPERFGPKD